MCDANNAVGNRWRQLSCQKMATVLKAVTESSIDVLGMLLVIDVADIVLGDVNNFQFLIRKSEKCFNGRWR